MQHMICFIRYHQNPYHETPRKIALPRQTGIFQFKYLKWYTHNHYSPTLHMVYDKISRAILAGDPIKAQLISVRVL